MFVFSSPDDFLYNLVTTSPSEARKQFKQTIKDEWNNSCCYCGSKHNLSLDHVIPKVKGGSDLKNNLVCACKSCNRDKAHSIMEDWYRNQDFFSEERLSKIKKWTNNDH